MLKRRLIIRNINRRFLYVKSKLCESKWDVKSKTRVFKTYDSGLLALSDEAEGLGAVSVGLSVVAAVVFVSVSVLVTESVSVFLMLSRLSQLPSTSANSSMPSFFREENS